MAKKNTRIPGYRQPKLRQLHRERQMRQENNDIGR